MQNLIGATCVAFGRIFAGKYAAECAYWSLVGALWCAEESSSFDCGDPVKPGTFQSVLHNTC